MKANGGSEAVLASLNGLGNPHRYELLRLLRDPAKVFSAQPAGAPDEVGVCVSDLQRQLGLSQSTTSQYLGVLERAGLVTAERIGQWTYWKSNADRLAALLRAVASDLTQGTAPALAGGTSGPGLAEVYAARARLQGFLRRTPLESAPYLVRLTGATDVWLKLEHHQRGGSAVTRGVFNVLLERLHAGQLPGVVAAGTGVAERAAVEAGCQLGVPVRAILGPGAPPVPGWDLPGVELRRCATAEAADAELAAASRAGYVPCPGPDDAAFVAGVGTLVLEIVEDHPEFDVLAFPAANAAVGRACGQVLGALLPAARALPIKVPDEGAAPPPNGPRTARLPDPARRHGPAVPEVSAAAATEAARYAAQEWRVALDANAAAPLAWLLSGPAEIRGGRVVAALGT